jgi:glycosyltransferase involved in cell wall biosynthesis
MRFVFISSMSGYPWGGSEELWSQAALHLCQHGHQVSALVPWWPQPAAQLGHLSENGIEVRMRGSGSSSLAKRVQRKLGRWLGEQSQNEDFTWILRRQPDFVCVSNGNYSDGLDSLEFCANHDLPYASIVQANAEFIWPDDRQAERLIRVYQKARSIFFVSQRNRELLEKQLGIPLNQAEVVRNPFNVRWNPVVPWPLVNSEWRMACVARLDPQAKGQDLLFEVMASDAWRSRPVKLSLFGKGSMEQGLKRLARRMGLKERVSFCGHVADIEKLWAEHHILVLPSRYEGLPLALVEAMLCSRPAIVTDVAGNAELVEDGDSGFVAAAPTKFHLVEAMERAWEHRAKWQEMGLAARAFAQASIPKDPAAMFARSLLTLAQKDAVSTR